MRPLCADVGMCEQRCTWRCVALAVFGSCFLGMLQLCAFGVFAMLQLCAFGVFAMLQLCAFGVFGTVESLSPCAFVAAWQRCPLTAPKPVGRLQESRRNQLPSRAAVLVAVLLGIICAFVSFSGATNCRALLLFQRQSDMWCHLCHRLGFQDVAN
jgi:hypothetical protein